MELKDITEEVCRETSTLYISSDERVGEIEKVQWLGSFLCWSL